MRIFNGLILCGVVCLFIGVSRADSFQESVRSINQESSRDLDDTFIISSDTTSTSVSKSTQNLQNSNKSFSLYQPIVVRKNTYAAFSIGYSYNHIATQSIALRVAPDSETKQNSAFSRVAHGAFFGLERGWHTHNVMLGGYLNGVAGQDYSLHLGFRLSYLAFGYVIPSVGISYGLQNLRLPNDSQQYNTHTAGFNAGLFVNVARGFGLKFEGSYFYPMGILRKSNADLYGNPRFSGYSFVVSFTFYDFSI